MDQIPRDSRRREYISRFGARHGSAAYEPAAYEPAAYEPAAYEPGAVQLVSIHHPSRFQIDAQSVALVPASDSIQALDDHQIRLVVMALVTVGMMLVPCSAMLMAGKIFNRKRKQDP